MARTHCCGKNGKEQESYMFKICKSVHYHTI